MNNRLELFAFYSNFSLSKECIDSGIDGIVIDWENSSKRMRQSLYNTQVNLHSEKELIEARKINSASIICRVNGGVHLSNDEISKALDLGADYIMVPMIKSLEDVEKALKAIDNKCKSVLMIETQESVKLVNSLKNYPVDKIYVGLNDLAISRNCNNIFLPFADGTIDHIREQVTAKFGVAGLTHSASGYPIPCHLLIDELKRIKCDFTFLRRSFYRDIKDYSIEEIILSIHDRFSKEAIHSQSKELKDLINSISQPLI